MLIIIKTQAKSEYKLCEKCFSTLINYSLFFCASFHVNEFEFTRNPLDLATHSKNLLENQIQQLGSSNPGRMNNYRTTATTNGNYMYDNNKREVNRGREYNQENYSSQLIDNNLMLKSR